MSAPPRAASDRKGGAISSATPDSRELAARESDGIHVLLLWHPREDELTVSIDDRRAGERFVLAVERDRALDAFYHPSPTPPNASKSLP
jgi:alkanesulfonate monooxygenase SsuD/methylene tetrahydromethanopterin reductase-like flavin-dependent oxidoreductase (luciferase family)